MLQERSQIPKENVEKYLEFIGKCEEKVHKNHYVSILSKRWILPFLKYDEKWPFLDDFSQVLTDLKLGLCKDKGRVLFEYSNAHLAVAKTDFNEGKLTLPELKKKLEKEIIPSFAKVKNILKYDFKNSYEGQICNASKQYETYLRNYIKE